MDSVTDICKYHFLCFVTIIQVKVISGHQVKKVKQKNRDLELRYMFLGQIFAKNAKNDPQTLFESSKWVKKQIRKITVKSRNDVKSACLPVFYMFYAISQPLLKILTWNCVHMFMRHYPLAFVMFFFENFDLGETVLKRKKIGRFFIFFLKMFKILKIRDSSFVALLILRHFM